MVESTIKIPNSFVSFIDIYNDSEDKYIPICMKSIDVESVINMLTPIVNLMKDNVQINLWTSEDKVAAILYSFRENIYV